MKAPASSLLTVFLFLFCASGYGQASPDAGQLAGILGPTSNLLTLRGELYKQAVDNNCATPQKVANITGLRMAISGGGTAYDAARSAVWVSDGTNIALQQLSGTITCAAFAATLSGTGTGYTVTGLAHCNKRKQLIQMEQVVGATSNSLVLRFYDTSACPPKLLTTTCSIPIPGGNTPGVAHGLAYDEARDLIFFTMSQQGTAGWSSTVNYVNFPVACLVKPSSFGVPSFTSCGGTNGFVKAMTYNSCTKVLCLTEGTVMLKLDISNISSPKNLNATTACCKFNVNGKGWAGLAIVPNSSSTSVGSSCVGSGCPSCTSMGLGFVGGDLALGNQDLALQITGAPGGGMAGLYLSLGKCQSPGLTLPGLCGQVHTPVSIVFPLFIGNFPLAGSACSGSLKLPTPVPTSTSLCNMPICTQFLVRCPAGGLAAGLTNAVEFSLGG